MTFQALRYPYFQIGHPLGSTTQSLPDSGKPQKDGLEKAGPPPHIKPVPPAQPPSKPHTRISSRPHQASQPPQYLMNPYEAEASRADHQSHLPEDKPSSLLFPSLHAKNPQAVSSRDSLVSLVSGWFLFCPHLPCNTVSLSKL